MNDDAVDGFLPISLCPTDGVWRLVRLPDGNEIVASFDGVGILSKKIWQTKRFAYHNPAYEIKTPITGVKKMSEPYDTYVICDLQEGIYPTHFRPNDTVFGGPKK